MKKKYKKLFINSLKVFIYSLLIFGVYLLFFEGFNEYYSYQLSGKTVIYVNPIIDELYDTMEDINAVPPELLSNLSGLNAVFIPALSWKLGHYLENNTKNYVGYYNGKLKNLVIYDAFESFNDTLYHELGHHFYETFLTQQERDEYWEIYTHYDQFQKESYYWESVHEDFAESFSYYFLGEKVYLEKHRYAFLSKRIEKFI